MIIIDSKIYREFAEKFIDEIGDKSYFRGSVEIDTEELYAELNGTFLIHRAPLHDPSDTADSSTEIVEISAVWWEFLTFQQQGEVYNTFSWQEFEEHLPTRRCVNDLQGRNNG